MGCADVCCLRWCVAAGLTKDENVAPRENVLRLVAHVGTLSIFGPTATLYVTVDLVAIVLCVVSFACRFTVFTVRKRYISVRTVNWNWTHPSS